MSQSPIPRALSVLFGSEARLLLMGGQACILYGAAEFSRDIDLAVLISGQSLEHLQRALDTLGAQAAFVPQLGEDVLLRGHACHFRCRAPGVEGLRIDVMGRLRGVASFSEVWARRVEMELPEVARVSVMALTDLVRSKKTQRDKDWPMVRRLVEADFHRREEDPAPEQVRFWLAESRTPEMLRTLAERYPSLTQEMAAGRPLLSVAGTAEFDEMSRLLREEEAQERERDRQYWAPLVAELESWRRGRRG